MTLPRKMACRICINIYIFVVQERNRMKKTVLFSICATTLLLYSCKDDETPITTNNQPQELCDSIAITYNGHVKAIMDVSCNTASCHAVSAGGFKLGTFNEVKTAAEKANFLGAIKHANGVEPMPKGGAKLGDDIIQQLECWEKTSFPEI
ncbi:MAG: hypothetical protein ACI9JN_002018 [Bacteroidia bacterium]